MNKGKIFIGILLASLMLGAGSAFVYALQPREYAVKINPVEHALAPYMDMTESSKPGAPNPGDVIITDEPVGYATPQAEFAAPYADSSQVCDQRALYDARGNPYFNGVSDALPPGVATVANYSGPSPMYLVEPYSSNVCDLDGSLRLQKIPPAEAIKGTPYYAIVTTIKIKKESMHAGESNILIADIELPERFNPIVPVTGEAESKDGSVVQSGYYVEHIDPAEVLNVRFGMESTGFELKAANPGARTLGVAHPASFRWIISPRGEAAGEQYLVLDIDSGKFKISQDVSLVVEEVGRLEPIYVGMTVSIGSFFATTYIPKAVPFIVKRVRTGTKGRNNE